MSTFQYLLSNNARHRFLGTLGISFILSACGGGGSGSNNEPAENQALSQDTAFAYVERSISADAAEGQNLYQSKLQDPESAPLDLNSPYAFQPGAQLVHRSSLDVDAVEWSVLRDYFGSTDYDVKDLSVSSDGSRVVFAAHGPLDHATDFTWNIYEYEFETRSLRRVIEDDMQANFGRDTNPTYTHDGRIVFSTDRAAGNPNHPTDNIVDEEQEENCYKVGPSEQPSLLHIMDANGDNIVQLTYGNNHDTKTTTLTDGTVAFVRWSRSYQLLPQCDNLDANSLSEGALFDNDYPSGLSKPESWSDAQLCSLAIPTPLGKALPSNNYTLLQIDPDTEQLAQLYETVTLYGSDEEFVFLNDLVQGRDGYLMGVMKHFYNEHQGGNLVSLQDPNYANDSQVFGKVAPRAIVSNDINMYPNQLSSDGWFSAVSPYRDGSSRVLMSWSKCATVNNGVNAFCDQGEEGSVNSQYGIWVYDPATDSRLPVMQARQDVVYTELAVAQNKAGADLPFAPVNANFVDNLDEARVICDDPSVPPEEPPVEDPPTDPEDPPTNPEDPPTDPEDPPTDPEDPPTDPEDPPTDPEDPPTDPEDPPTDPEDPPTDPEDPPTDPEDPPTDPANQAPVANAGDDQNAFVGDSVNFDGSASNDPDNGPQALTYQWSFSVLPMDSGLSDGDIANATSATPSFVPDVRGDYELVLTVSDGEKSASDSAAVLMGNNAPVAKAGADQNVHEGASVTLDGSESFDLDNDRLSYTWAFSTKPPTSVLTNDNIAGRFTPNPSFTPDTGVVLPIKADFVFIVDGSYSMDEEIEGVRAGLRAFVEQLSDPDNDIDARFAVVTYEERPLTDASSVKVGLSFTQSTTEADVADAVIQAFDDIVVDSLGGQQREAGLEAIRAVLGDSATVSNPIAGLEFRDDARKNLILATDEDSDGPYNGGDYEAPKDSDISNTSWQDEVDQTAAVVINNAAFIDMLIEPENGATTQQYGDPAADRTEVDSDIFDSAATLAALGDSNSLQAQVLQAGLIARSYYVTDANSDVFVDSFFNSKVESTGDNPLLGYYVLSLVVDDGTTSSETDSVAVQAYADNAAPNARAGADQNAVPNSVVQLNGGDSYDSDASPSAITYSWTFAEVPTGSALGDGNIANANSIKASFTPDVTGTYIVELTVNDGGAGSSGFDTDRVVVTVSNTTAPNADAGDNQSVANCSAVNLDASGSFDADGGPQGLGFSWILVSRPDGSALMSQDIDNSDSANASFTADLLGSFVFAVQVDDGQDSDSDHVMITVGDPSQSGMACP